MSGLRVCMRLNNPFTRDPRVEREARALVDAGHDVTVVADARPELPAEEMRHGIRIVRIGKTSRIPYASIVRPLMAERADVYHAHDIDSLFPCVAAARLTGGKARIVYDSHELWSAHARDKVHARRRTLIRYEGQMLRRADALISVSPEITAIIAEKHRFAGIAETIRNVPRAYSDAELAPHWAARDADPLARISYVGVHQHGRGAVPLVRALEHLPAEFAIDLVGPFPQPEYLELVKAAAEPFGDRVRFVGEIAPEMVVPTLAEAKLSAVLIEPVSESYRLSAPNKLFDSLAAGTPSIASDLPTIAAVTRETGAGVVCDVADPADIARAALEAHAHSEQMRAAARAAHPRFSWEAEAGKLVTLYERLQ